MSESIRIEKADSVEILFTDKSGCYKAYYSQGDLVSVRTDSSNEVPTEIDFTFEQTMLNLQKLGYNETNGSNEFTFSLPTTEEQAIRFEFIKGESYEN